MEGKAGNAAESSAMAWLNRLVISNSTFVGAASSCPLLLLHCARASVAGKSIVEGFAAVLAIDGFWLVQIVVITTMNQRPETEGRLQGHLRIGTRSKTFVKEGRICHSAQFGPRDAQISQSNRLRIELRHVSQLTCSSCKFFVGSPKRTSRNRVLKNGFVIGLIVAEVH
jgi:hypothetical protein